MLEQSANALRFWAFYTNSGARATGLTVTVDVWRNLTQIVTGAACTELGNGQYYYDLGAGSVTVEGDYRAVFTTAGTVDVADIIAAWWVDKAGVEHLDEDVSAGGGGDPSAVWSYATRTLTAFSPEVVVRIPTFALGQLSIVKGDYYDTADNTALTFSDAGSWIDLTGKTFKFRLLSQDSDDDEFETTDCEYAVVSSVQKVYVNLTSTQTNALRTGSRVYLGQLLVVGGLGERTLWRDDVTVLERAINE